MTPEIKKALDLALEALRSASAELYRASSYCNTYEVLGNTNDAITAIQQALESPTVQEPEIVQRVKRYAGQTMRTARNPNITARECIELANWIVTTQPAAQPAAQEPINVAQAYAMAQVCLDLHDAIGCKWGDNPYLTISQLKAAAPVPLTDEEITAHWDKAGELRQTFIEFARSIEAAHGITAAPEKGGTA
jgi:hypothetical protein